jgi:hypothetical protein
VSTFMTIAVLLAASAMPASAQQPDTRWSHWVGCWQMLDERLRDSNPTDAEAVEAAGVRTPRATRDIVVCVAPAQQSGAVTLITRAAGQPVLEQTIVADGAAHPIAETGCSGTQQAEWSQDGQRVFTRGQLACANQPARAVSGLSLITPDGTWLDVQGIDVAGRTNVRVRRYAPLERPTAGMPALTTAAVKEASAKVAAPVLEAALIETNARFALDNRSLVELADARVPGSVIDLMVALSRPEKFRVERRPESALDLYPAVADAEWSGLWGFGYPYMPWYPGYSGGYYRYYYSPFAYGLYDLYGPYSSYFYPTTYVAAGSGSDGGGDVSAPRSGQGRVIDGVGYTRIRPRDAEPVESAGGESPRTRGTLSPSGATQSSGGAGATTSGGGSGSSGGGDSGGGGRTAQPR